MSRDVIFTTVRKWLDDNLFVFCLIQFSLAWIYPSRAFGPSAVVIQERLMAGPFVYGLWLFVLIGYYFHINKFGFSFSYSIVKPLVPFILLGTISTFFSQAPFDSFRLLILYFLMIIAAVLTSSSLTVSSLERVVYKSFAAIIIFSLLYSFIFPSLGAQYYGSELAWRGFFAHKNGFGWFSAIALLVSLILFDKSKIYTSSLFVFFPVVALWFSQSKSSLVAVLFCLIFVRVVYFLQKYISLGLNFFVLIFVAILSTILLYFFLDDILSLLGRDITLTGRTLIWKLYLNSMMASPFLGAGPGSYTSISDFTMPLAFRLQEYGSVFNPHNLYLATFGEVGLFGLLAYISFIFYIMLGQYYISPNRYTLLSSSIALLLLIGGFTEAHEVLTPGLTMYLLLVFRGMSIRSSSSILS